MLRDFITARPADVVAALDQHRSDSKAGSVGRCTTVQLKTRPRPLALNQSNPSAPHHGHPGRGANRGRPQSVQRFSRSSWRRQPSQNSRLPGPGAGSGGSIDVTGRSAARRWDRSPPRRRTPPRRRRPGRWTCRGPAARPRSGCCWYPWMKASESWPPWVFTGKRPSGHRIAPSATKGPPRLARRSTSPRAPAAPWV
jgi:hypothetical protein